MPRGCISHPCTGTCDRVSISLTRFTFLSCLRCPVSTDRMELAAASRVARVRPGETHVADLSEGGACTSRAAPVEALGYQWRDESQQK
jgi:hypothetical protein